MQYRKDKYGNEVSVLGYGCMRFTSKAGMIDIDKTEKEILEAYHNGVNYYDTAYIYPGSESALGEILARNNIRDEVYIATKLPHYMLKKPEQMDKFFYEELKRLKTDHIDYYLMHMLTDDKTWKRLCELGIEEWLAHKKETGEIRQVGFSYHGNSDVFKRVVDVYDWDFCQIQYNYLDEHSQAGRTGLQYAHAKGLPVIIMEPLRGGKLVNLPEKAMQLLSAHKPVWWSFNWLWDQKEVTCILSGMNSMDMVKENIAYANESHTGILSENEHDLLKQTVEIINENMKVGCTGCRYCMPCPFGVDIPGSFAAYNRTATDGKIRGLMDYLMCTGIRSKSTGVTNCKECGKCEQHCPQHIEIRKELKNVKKEFEGPLTRIIRKLLPIFMKY